MPNGQQGVFSQILGPAGFGPGVQATGLRNPGFDALDGQRKALSAPQVMFSPRAQAILGGKNRPLIPLEDFDFLFPDQAEAGTDSGMPVFGENPLIRALLGRLFASLVMQSLGRA